MKPMTGPEAWSAWILNPPDVLIERAREEGITPRACLERVIDGLRALGGQPSPQTMVALHDELGIAIERRRLRSHRFKAWLTMHHAVQALRHDVVERAVRSAWAALGKAEYYEPEHCCQECGWELEWSTQQEDMRATCTECGAVNEIEAEADGDSEGWHPSWCAVRATAKESTK